MATVSERLKKAREDREKGSSNTSLVSNLSVADRLAKVKEQRNIATPSAPKYENAFIGTDYEKYLSAPDYAEKSKPLNVTDELSLYNYINNKEALSTKGKVGWGGLISKIDNKHIQDQYGLKNFAEEFFENADYMTDDEKSLYNYLYNTDKKSADSYEEFLKSTLNKRKVDAKMGYAEEFGKEHKVLGSIESAFNNVVSPFEVAINAGYSKLTGEEQNPYDAYYNAYNATALRNGASSDMGKVGSFLYEVGMSMLDSVNNMLIYGGMASLPMGINAFQTSYLEATQRGLDNEHALQTATIAGILEVATETISVESFLSLLKKGGSEYMAKDWLKGVSLEALKQMGFEASEEIASEIGNTIFDAVHNKDMSEYNQNVNAYIENGYSEEEAKKKAFGDIVLNVALAGLGGGVSGLFFGVGGGAINVGKATYVGNKVSKNGNRDTLINYAKDLGSKDVENLTENKNGKMANTELGFAVRNLETSELERLDKEYKKAKSDYEKAILSIRANQIKSDIDSIVNNYNIADKYNYKEDSAVNALKEEITSKVGKEDLELATDAFNLAVENARANVDLKKALKNKSILSEADIKQIYNTVSEVRTERKTAIDALKNEAPKSVLGGTLDIQNVDVNHLTTKQSEQYMFASIISAIGFNVSLYESTFEQRANGTPNGYIKNDVIYIDINANFSRGALGKAFMTTMSHEMTHAFKNTSGYAELEKSALNFQSEHSGKSVTQVIKDKQDEIESRRKKSISEQEAIDEIVAQTCEDMLLNSEYFTEVVSNMSEKEARNFFEKVKALFGDIINWLKKCAKQFKSDSEEAIALRSVHDKFVEMQKKWDACFKDYLESKKNSVTEASTTEELDAKARELNDGISSVTDDGVLLNERTDTVYDMMKDEDKKNPIRFKERDEYKKDIDDWTREGRPLGENFVIGTSSAILQGLGSEERDIYIRGDKIKVILGDKDAPATSNSLPHKEITIEHIKKIPRVLENPILIIKSITANNSILVIGDVKGDNTLNGEPKDLPMIVVMNLLPTDETYYVEDMQKVASAYTKNRGEKQVRNLFNNSEVLYVDKKRAISLLHEMGIKNPIRGKKNGFLGNITYGDVGVNISGESFSDVFDLDASKEEMLNSDRITDKEYSELARTNPSEAEKVLIEVAKQNGWGMHGLLHGSDSFGFTEFDLNKMDDGRSIFLTDSYETASSYTESDNIRTIQPRDISGYSDKEILNEYNKRNKLSSDDHYRIMKKSDIEELIEKYRNSIEYTIHDIENFESFTDANFEYAKVEKEDIPIVMKILSEMKSIVEEMRDNGDNNGELLDKLVSKREDLRSYFQDIAGAKIVDVILNFRNLVNEPRYLRTLLKNLSKGTKLAYNGQMLSEVSMDWMRETLQEDIETEEGGIYKLFAKMEKPLIVDAQKKSWSKIDILDFRKEYEEWWEKKNNRSVPKPFYTANTRQLSEYAKDNGYDGLIISNVLDYGAYARDKFIDIYEPSNIYVVFNPSSVKSADLLTYDEEGNEIPLSERFNADNDDIRYSDRITDSEGNELSEGQVKFFEKSKVRDSEGKLKKVFHGTIREFYEFSRSYGNAEGDMGKGFYLTSSEEDVWNNYANENGADLTQKIEREAERIEGLLEDYDGGDEGLDEFNGKSFEEIVEIVKSKEITSEKPIVIEAYANIENPCYVGSNETWLLSDVASEISEEDYEDEDEYYQAKEDASAEIVDDVINYLYDEFENTDAYEQDIREILYNAIYDDGITLERLKQELSGKFIEDGEGNLYSNELARLIVEALGYDGIIDDTVSKKFRGMKLSKDTIHYIAFNSEQIKRTDNLNPTKDRDIRYSDRFSDDGAYMTNARLNYEIEDSTAGSRKDYAQKWITKMSPRAFLDMTTKISREEFDRRENDYGTNMSQYDFIEGLKKSRQTPFLYIEAETGNVVGHEGRHRMRALEKKGIRSAEVIIQFYSSDGYMIKNYNEVDGRLKKKLTLKIRNQWGTNETELIHYIYPLNEDHREEIFANFGEDHAGKNDIRYSDIVDRTSDSYKTFNALDEFNESNEVLTSNAKTLRDYIKLEGKVTNGTVMKDTDATKIAKRILSKFDSKRNVTKLTEDIKELYSFLNGDESDSFFLGSLYNVASMVADESEGKIENPYVRMILKSIKQAVVKPTSEQIAVAKARFGDDYESFFKGKIKLSESGDNLSEWYDNMALGYGEETFVPTEDENKLVAIYDTITALRKEQKAYTTIEQDALTKSIANDIMEGIWNSVPYQTVADKYEKKIAGMKKKYESKLKALKEKRAKDIDSYKKYHRDAMRNLKHSYSVNAQKKKLINNIKKVVFDLNEKLVKNSKDKHINEAFKKDVAEILRAIDLSSKTNITTGEMTASDERLAKKFAHLASIIKDNSYGTLNSTEKIDEFVSAGDFTEAFAERVKEVAEVLDKLAESTNGKTFIINAMSLEELQALNDVLVTLRQIINNTNRVLSSEHKMEIENLAMPTINECELISKRKRNRIIEPIANILNYSMALPKYFFKLFGENGAKVFSLLQNGLDKLAFNTQDILNYTKDIYDAKDVKRWRKEVHEFTSYNGHKFKMTTSQMMSLYALSKREQGLKHILNGGIRVDDFKIGLNIVEDKHGALLNEADIKEITDELAKDSKALDTANKLVWFMSNTCSDWGNHITMIRFGIKQFTEKWYFPITSDPNNITSGKVQEKQMSMFRLLNADFTQNLNAKATNKILVRDFFEVFSEHTSEMAMYNAMALPILDVFKWYNFKKPTENRGDYITLKSKVREAFGDEAITYITTLLIDLNGSNTMRMDNIEKGAKKFIRNFKASAVMKNLRVTLLQPTAYLRASAIIDKKYLVTALGGKPATELAKQYCGIALWKSFGFYEINIAPSMEELITNGLGKTDPAGFADEVTWGYLYKACMLEAKSKGLSGEEMYKKAGERLTEIVYETQVVDSTLTRSQAMRNKSTYAQILTAFMSESTISYNLLYGTAREFEIKARRMGKDRAFREMRSKLGKAMLAYLLTLLSASVVGSLVDKMRDTDDEKKFHELFFENMAEDGLGMLPYVKDFVSIAEGFNPSRMDEEWMQSIIKAGKQWSNGEVNYKDFHSTLKVVSQLSGKPWFNEVRDLVAIWNRTVAQIFPSLKIE